LSNQDPFQPNDANALLEQLNSIRSIESDMKLTQKLESLVTENQLGAASGMIGKFIGGMTEDRIRVAGYVVSVVRQGSDISLELDNGWVVPFSGVETVIDPETLPDDVPPPARGGDSDNASQ
jgi:flagellar hook assembly protein FlgD